MEVKSKIFIVVACWLIMATMAMAALQRLPLCKKLQKDLTGPFARILKKYKESVGKRLKRETKRRWSVNCFLASFIKDENNEIVLSLTIGGCCDKCMFPDYTRCVKNRTPYWECASDAYDCVYNCRNEASVVDAVLRGSELGLLGRKRHLIPNSKGFEDLAKKLWTKLTRLVGGKQDLQARAAKLWKVLLQLRKREECFEKKCTGRGSKRKCCLIKTCLSVKELHKIKKFRGMF